MNKFGSQFKHFYYLNFIFLSVLLILLIIVKEFHISSYFIVILVFAFVDLLELYLSFNGLAFNEKHFTVCNYLIPVKYSIRYENIEKITLAYLITTAYIKIFTKDYEQKKFFIRGFSREDLKKYSDKFNELGINAVFLNRS